MTTHNLNKILTQYFNFNKENRSAYINCLILSLVIFSLIISIFFVGSLINQKEKSLATLKNEHAEIFSKVKYIVKNQNKNSSQMEHGSILSATHALVGRVGIDKNLSGLNPSRMFDNKKGVEMHLEKINSQEIVSFLKGVNSDSHLHIHKFEVLKNLDGHNMLDVNMVLTANQ